MINPSPEDREFSEVVYPEIDDFAQVELSVAVKKGEITDPDSPRVNKLLGKLWRS